MREAVAGIYASWTQQIAGLLTRQGVSDERASNLATAAVAAIEGALLPYRAIGSLKPLSSTADLIGASLNRVAANWPNRPGPPYLKLRVSQQGPPSSGP